MEPCKYFYETDGLIVRIVDTWKNWEESVQICEQFGEQLAPINNWKRFNDTLIQLGDCFEDDVHGVRKTISRSQEPFRVGFKIKNGSGIWSDSTLYNFDQQKSLFHSLQDNISSRNTFCVGRNRNKIDSYLDDLWDFSFLCSKDKSISDGYFETNNTKNGLTDLTSNTSTGASLFIGISLGLVLFLFMIGFLIYLKKKNKQRNVSDGANESQR